MRAPDFWTRPAGLLSAALAPLAAAYDLAGRLRRSLVRPTRVAVPVLCVGNLVAGGAGKTPVAIALAERLAGRGRAPHLISRGYGGREAGPLRIDPAAHSAARVGDEPLLLARVAPAWVARDRVAGARAAIDAGADCLLLDDGFQNPRLAKDLSLVVVDGESGFGNGRVMPAGPLRESIAQGLARADAVVLIGDDSRDLASRLPPGLPLLHARLLPAAEAEDLRGEAVLAFAGIGRPEKLFATLRGLGARLVESRAFPDHHPYSTAEVEALLTAAADLGAVAVTTEKDAVRLPSAQRARVRSLGVVLQWADETALDSLLDAAGL